MKLWFFEWVFSICLVPIFLYALSTNRMFRLIVAIGLVSLLIYVLIRVFKKKTVPLASSVFLYTGKKKERRIHFRSMKERPEFGIREMVEFKRTVGEFQKQGVKRIVAQTIIDPAMMESFGFRQFAISSPVTHMVTVLMTVLRTRQLTEREKHWCRAYVLDVDNLLQKRSRKGRGNHQTS